MPTFDHSTMQQFNIVGTSLLDDYDINSVINDIAQRIQRGFRLIVPIGMPQAGKSMFIASLIAYAFRRTGDNSCNFVNCSSNEDDGGVKAITDALDQRRVIPSTTAGFITIIDIEMTSRYRKNKKVRISLIDLAGEDIERLIGRRTDEDGRAAKIMAILAACIARKAIFAIISPVEPGTDLGYPSDIDTAEDSAMRAFIDKLKQENPRLFSYTKFLFIVTKWDQLPRNVNVERYLKVHRPQLYTEYKNSGKHGLLPYTVGNVVAETIVSINMHSPKNFWYTLYRWCTGRHVLPWWKRIF